MTVEVVAPRIGYQETILRATHEVTNFYPVQFTQSELTKTGSRYQDLTATNEPDFTHQLREFLKSDKIIGLIEALLAQSITGAADEDEE